MYARGYFAGKYFAPRYWPDASGEETDTLVAHIFGVSTVSATLTADAPVADVGWISIQRIRRMMMRRG